MTNEKTYSIISCVIISALLGVISACYYPIPPVEKDKIPLFNISITVLPVIIGFFLTSIGILSLFDNEISKLSIQIINKYKKTFTLKITRYSFVSMYYFATIAFGCFIQNFYDVLPCLDMLIRFFIFMCTSSLIGSIFFPLFIRDLVIKKYNIMLEVKKILNDEERKQKKKLEELEKLKNLEENYNKISSSPEPPLQTTLLE